MIPSTAQVIEITKAGGPEVLKPAIRPTPVPAKGEVLIQVAAAGINRPDLLQRAGAYPAPPGASDLPGLEVAGIVVAHGEGVSEPGLGTKVCALCAGGGYAEYVTVDARHCLPVPQGFSWAEAASLPETFFTVWHNVFERGALKAGETLLVHGGAGGIGSTAIQMAKAMGAKVFTTVNGPEKVEFCRQLGADRAIDYASEDFVDVIKTETKGGVNVILDMVGGSYLARNIRCLAVEGRMVSIAYLQGSTAEINFMPVMLKRLTLTGSTLRPQSDDAKARMAQSLATLIWPKLEQGLIRSVVSQTFPLAQAEKAHELMEANAHMGKIVLVTGI